MAEISFLKGLVTWRWPDPDRILTVLAAIFVFLLIVQTVRYQAAKNRLEKTLTRSVEQRTQEPVKREGVDTLEEYISINEHGLLGTIGKPIEKLWGIMGDSALIGASADNAKAYSVGEAIPSGEKVIKMGHNEVVLEQWGTQRTEHVFAEMIPKPKPEPIPQQNTTNNVSSNAVPTDVKASNQSVTNQVVRLTESNSVISVKQ